MLYVVAIQSANDLCVRLFLCSFFTGLMSNGIYMNPLSAASVSFLRLSNSVEQWYRRDMQIAASLWSMTWMDECSVAFTNGLCMTLYIASVYRYWCVDDVNSSCITNPWISGNLAKLTESVARRRISTRYRDYACCVYCFGPSLYIVYIYIYISAFCAF